MTWCDGGLMPGRPDALPDSVTLDRGGGVILIGEKGILLHGTYGEQTEAVPRVTDGGSAARAQESSANPDRRRAQEVGAPPDELDRRDPGALEDHVSVRVCRAAHRDDAAGSSRTPHRAKACGSIMTARMARSPTSPARTNTSIANRARAGLSKPYQDRHPEPAHRDET